MKTKFLVGTLVLAAACCSVAQVLPSRHVWIVTEENHSFEAASASMPFLMSLGNQYGTATQYYADMHNSISALMHLTAGQTVTADDNTSDTFNVDNIVRHLTTKGLTFRSYQEGLPHTGFLGLWSGLYVKRHNPLAYFSDVAQSSLRFNLVPLAELASDLANHRTGNYNYVTPDLDNDAHDGSLRTADQWLSHNLPPILAQPEFQPGGDGLLFVVFDEGNLGSDPDFRCNDTTKDNSCGGRVLTVVVGPNVKRGFQSATFYNHESLLATVCQALGTDGCPGKAEKARPMKDFFLIPLSPSPAAATVSSGQPAQFTLTVQPVSGFYDAEVTFSCDQLPAGAQCSFSPATLRPGSDGASTTLTVSLSPRAAGLRRFLGRRTGSELALWLALPGLALLPGAREKRKRKLILGVAGMAATLFCLGCGGGGGASASGTSTIVSGQTYTFRVTAQSPSATFSVPVRVRVTN